MTESSINTDKIIVNLIIFLCAIILFTSNAQVFFLELAAIMGLVAMLRFKRKV